MQAGEIQQTLEGHVIQTQEWQQHVDARFSNLNTMMQQQQADLQAYFRHQGFNPYPGPCFLYFMIKIIHPHMHTYAKLLHWKIASMSSTISMSSLSTNKLSIHASFPKKNPLHSKRKRRERYG
uniref:Uncharacterized protein n=1 Tax=Oryza sativa subsp. japonica TaxID=39947 RepID=Q2QPS0_ORYSJ|nr:hypothetical protein LOC_Os12g33510 [Oryza sativa Japonica Group]